MALANVIKHLKFRARKLQQGLKGAPPIAVICVRRVGRWNGVYRRAAL